MKSKLGRVFFIIIILVLIVSGTMFGYRYYVKSKEVVMPSIVGLDEKAALENLELLAENSKEVSFNNISVEYIYDKAEKGKVIEQSVATDTILNNKDIDITIIVSKGELNKDMFRELGVNELGRIPVMMYHGIFDMLDSETKYTGGNYDSSGYNRTTESFRRDLEMYHEKGYYPIKIEDYINGHIDVPLGKSPIVLTFDDGHENNFRVLGKDDNGDLIIDPNSAVGIMEEFKEKYPDWNVTASFYLNGGLFFQPEYDEEIITWLVDNGYEVGNHTVGHDNLESINKDEVFKTIEGMEKRLEKIIPGRHLKVLSRPFGTPYRTDHKNFEAIFQLGLIGTLQVGWMPDLSPYHNDFDPLNILRVRAYDNNGNDWDIEYVFNELENYRYISDGDPNRIVISSDKSDNINEIYNNDNYEIIEY